MTTPLDFSGVEKLLTKEEDARRGELLRAFAAVYGNGDAVIAAMKATAPDWVYEYQYYAEYLERGVFDGRIWGKDDFTGDCGCSGGLRDNVFRTMDGGADYLYGRGGNDTYHLNYGTGKDRIDERPRDSDYGGDAGDVIKVAPGIGKDRVLLSREQGDMLVSLLDANGNITDTLTVVGHYTDKAARVEKVLFEDGTAWGAKEFARAVLHAGRGSMGADTYDLTADGRAETAHGGRGADVYLLGRGSGNDTIDEVRGNLVGNRDVDVVRLKAGLTAADVRLLRSREDLIIHVLSADGARVSNTLTVSNHYVLDVARIERVELSGGALLWDKAAFANAVLADAGTGDDTVVGLFGADVLSGANGGNDTLRGSGGDDVYLFGRGSGHDTVDEGFQNFGSSRDVVRLAAGVAAADVSLSRTASDLVISLKNAQGAVTDTLTVKDYYVSGIARIERVELSNGALLWDKAAFAAVSWTPSSYTQSTTEIVGSAGADSLYGLDGTNDVFDADAGGNDMLRGRSGNDVYWLGRDTGFDVIDEGYRNSGGGDAGDIIKVKPGIAPSSVALVRTDDGLHMVVLLLDAKGAATDALTVRNYYTDARARIERVEFADGTVWGAEEFAAAPVVGGAGNDTLYGVAGVNDVFDSSSGGNDTLRGRSGDDVYWLGRGTGVDTIDEGYRNSARGDAGDTIKVKPGIAPSSVALVRSDNGRDLYVRLLDAKGVETDALIVKDHYAYASTKIERIEFADGTVWGADKLAAVPIRGTAGNDDLYGSNGANDVFDTSAGGNDHASGRGGNDTYWLGKGTGHDKVWEYYQNPNTNGDADDKIKVKPDIDMAAIELWKSGGDLVVQVNGAAGNGTDSLTVKDHFANAAGKVESIELGNKVLRMKEYQRLINAIAVFTAGDSSHETLAQVHGEYWEDISLSSS